MITRTSSPAREDAETAAAALSAAEKIADAVLFEGYMLYPYRANDTKNRIRWQFGVLVPQAFSTIDNSERSFLRTEFLLEGANPVVAVRARFLHVLHRTVLTAQGLPTGTLDVDDATYLPWDEAVVRDAEFEFDLSAAGGATAERTIGFEGGSESERLTARDGRVAGQLVRTWRPLTARLACTAEILPGPYGVRRLRLHLENRTDWAAGDSGPPRADAMHSSLVAAHLLVAVRGGSLLSAIDPPEWASGYTAGCEQVGAFPVLAGPPGDHHLMLCSPIILYDHPLLAPESTAEFCDATEMDEMLTLRTLTLTETEKRQVRGSDPRAAALVDQVDHLPPELMDRLHGAIRSMTSLPHATLGGPVPRIVAQPQSAAAAPTPMEDPVGGPATPWWDPAQDAAVDPDTDLVMIGGVAVSRGSAVRLRPGAHRADAQDMFLDGRTATVQAVLRDVDGGHHLAVSLDDLEDLQAGYFQHGRYLYFAPDEVIPIGGR